MVILPIYCGGKWFNVMLTDDTNQPRYKICSRLEYKTNPYYYYFFGYFPHSDGFFPHFIVLPWLNTAFGEPLFSLL